ncbi:angiotensin-converting enzyme-like [Stegodyphus dumicola]|uniref:angiotensin-converting enzyme-like n=1 Tax=Stegodyphus dumicola TaxID=202533 RepID=UPI0015ADA8A9|nr:angiotensin-converting enzyme-like [Stegodyphus dumicola]
MHLGTFLIPLWFLLFDSTVEGAGILLNEKYISGDNKNETAAIQFLQQHDIRLRKMLNKQTHASWNYASNLTEANKKTMLKVELEAAEFTKESWKNATSFAWKDFRNKNETVYRWFKKLSVLGYSALPPEDFKELSEIVADMQDIYSRAKICNYKSPAKKDCNLSLEPELTEILATSTDYDELKHVWSGWRNATGRKMKDKYVKYVKLSNKASRLNGFSDTGMLWREVYESDTFEEDIEALFQKIKPFYKHMHAYVRRKLIERYPKHAIKPDGPIPAHLLGNMWAQTWGNILPEVMPYPKKKELDITSIMKEKKMKIIDMFTMSDEFFTSVGLKKMTPEFWNNSIIEKPKDREMVCHASAWDFYDGKDVRIKMCTQLNMNDFKTVHHEMGHIEYFLQYAHQPTVFRRGANPGFHEAIGDVMALSVSTPQHWVKVGLVDDVEEDKEADINYLMDVALNKVVFLPFAYVMDNWRWKLFSGEIKEDEMNSEWWNMRLKYQGLCPPVKRTNEDLDAACKYHTISDVKYIRYFVAHIIQFQFHKDLCDAAGHEGPLHKCDIYKSENAGKLLRDMMRLGSSVHWEKAMQIITNGKTYKMDARPLLEYFDPLIKWLHEQNKNETVGWKSSSHMECPQ